jgi:hypothetical protein
VRLIQVRDRVEAYIKRARELPNLNGLYVFLSTDRRNSPVKKEKTSSLEDTAHDYRHQLIPRPVYSLKDTMTYSCVRRLFHFSFVSKR